jgi:hypothetical protein
VTPTRYRVVLTLLGIALVAIVVLAVVLTPEGRTPRLPDALDAYSPEDGATVLRQTQLVIDLQPGYDLDLVIDGQAIPDAELDGTPETGRFVYVPGPGKTIEAWAPGFHAIEATWERTTGLPDPGSLRWSFRVQ